MPRKTDNSFAGSFTWFNGGAGGGGFTTGIDISANGTQVCRTDCLGIAGIKKPGETEWTQLFRWGENTPTSRYKFKADVPFVVETSISWTNPNKVLSLFQGRAWLTKDGAVTQNVLDGFKGGNFDATLTFQPDHDARTGARRCGIDPNNENIMWIGHPVDGFYYSLDEGVTWTLHPGIPAPINSGDERRGVNGVFHRDSLAAGRSAMFDLVVAGRGTYRFTNGLNSTPVLLPGGPTESSDLAAGGNGRLYVCGTGRGAATGLNIYNGTSWSQNSSVVALTVCVDPTNYNKVATLHGGGGVSYSTDGGVTFAHYDEPTTVDADGDQKWIETVNTEYMAAAQMRWDVRSGVNKWVIAYGLGILEYDNPPRMTTAQKYKSRSTGINQMLMMNVHRATNGDYWMAAQDKPVWKFAKGELTAIAKRSYPDNAFPLRMGTDVDTAPEDPNFAVAVWLAYGVGPGTIKYTEDGGNTWQFPATTPTFVQSDGSVTPMLGGQIVVLSKTNWIWTGCRGGAIWVTKDKGATWQEPVFRHTAGGPSIDMSSAFWNPDYTIRRKTLVKTGQANTATVTCIGHMKRSPPEEAGQVLMDGSPEDLAVRGEWRTTDGGSTFIRLRGQAYWNNPVSAFYGMSKKYSFANPNHMLACAGNHHGPSNPSGGMYPSDWSVVFSADQGVTATELSGFFEVEAGDFGAPRNTGGPPAVYIRGWKGTVRETAVYGIYVSENLDVTNPNAATWSLVDTFPFGRGDEGPIISADPEVFGRLVFVIPSGNYVVRDYKWDAKAV